jgi:hypothetical protein
MGEPKYIKGSGLIFYKIIKYKTRERPKEDICSAGFSYP